MITYIKRDITTVEHGIVAHGVNCQHKMASGVAKAIRAKWPVVYETFMSMPKGKTMLGTSVLVDVDPGTDSLFVSNCYTQQFYGYGGGAFASEAAVQTSMERTIMLADFYDLPVYLPKIGAGLGGLSWDDQVEPIVSKLDEEYTRVDMVVCEI